MTDIAATLAERGARYGVFAEHAVIAQALQDAMRSAPGWQNLAPDQKQALSVISDKIARMLNGDPNYVDNWHDIIGYAKLVEDRLLGRGLYATPAEAVVSASDPAPAPAERPWIEWEGGTRPVDRDALVEVKFKHGPTGKNLARYWQWDHAKGGGPGDIVAYRVID